MSRAKNQAVFTPQEKQSIFSLAGIFFFRMSGLFLVLPIFSVLAEDLENATPATIGFAFGAYGLTQALLQIPFGMLSDRYGRKPVIAGGLVLFMLGSAYAAFATTIEGMIIARLLQGSGAISAAIFALIADLTRDEVRARANAGLGMGVGLAFGVSFLIAPFLGKWFGLSGLFWLIALMGMISLVILFLWVPTPPKKGGVAAKNTVTLRMILDIWGDSALRIIFLGTFVCSLGMSAVFFLLPKMLDSQGFEVGELWKIYIPMLFCGALAMVPAAILAEVKNRFREVMMGGAVLLIISFLALWPVRETQTFAGFIVVIFLFFMGYNVFEPLFPSLVTRLTTEQTKGTASGMYNFFQFIGYFLGGALAGRLYHYSALWLTLILGFSACFFFYRLLAFPNPQPRKPQGDEFY